MGSSLKVRERQGMGRPAQPGPLSWWQCPGWSWPASAWGLPAGWGVLTWPPPAWTSPTWGSAALGSPAQQLLAGLQLWARQGSSQCRQGSSQCRQPTSSLAGNLGGTSALPATRQPVSRAGVHSYQEERQRRIEVRAELLLCVSPATAVQHLVVWM